MLFLLDALVYMLLLLLAGALFLVGMVNFIVSPVVFSFVPPFSTLICVLSLSELVRLRVQGEEYDCQAKDGVWIPVD